jgi:hypothetical protein
MYYCGSIFSVTPQNYACHIIKEKGENEIIMEKGKVMKNKMMGQVDFIDNEGKRLKR